MAPPIFTVGEIAQQLQRQWGGANEGTTRTWTDGTIDYSMPSLAPNNNGANEAAGFVPMTALEIQFAREAFELWDDLIQSDLNEVNSQDAQITLGYSSTTNGGGTYTTPFLVPLPPGGSVFDRTIDHERVWMSANAATWPELQNANIGYGERGMETYIHEIGHSLGLSHPGTYNAGDGSTYATGAEYTQDTQQWTIMSYWAPGADGTVIDRTAPGSDVNGDGINASTPLLHDIAAIQAKYGASVNTRAGDTTYGFNSTANRGAFDFNQNVNPVVCIWDSGGIDRLDCSGFTQNQRIDLGQGMFSDVGALTLNVSIAFNCDIENASGGSGNDSITGNSGDNSLNGLAGNDSIFGIGGTDTLFGNEGNDTLDGGIGFVDTLRGGSGDDTYVVNDLDSILEFFNDGTDTVRSTIRWVLGDNLENLILEGGASVNGFGNALNNVMVGNSGNNYLQGFAGLDTLYGGAGNDYFELGDITFIDEFTGWEYDEVHESAGGGNDTISVGYFGNSNYTLAENVENLIVSGTQGFMIFGNALSNGFTGNSGNNQFYGLDGNDTLNGSTGIDQLYGGPGNDTYILDDLWQANQFALFTYDQIGESAGEGIDTVLVQSIDNPDTIFATDGYTLGPEIENGVITGGNAFNLTGNVLANALTGNGAVNTLNGLGGNDTLAGGDAFDRLFGGTGDDTYILNDLNAPNELSLFQYDLVSENPGEGNDTVFILALDNPDTISSVETYTLGPEIENGVVTGSLAFNLTGNGAANALTGNTGANTLSGLTGNDTLAGGAAYDRLFGGAGDDVYILTDLNAPNQFSLFAYDLVSENPGEGTDTVQVLALDNPDTISGIDRYTLGAEIENGIIAGAIAFNMTGNALNNALTGNGAANTLTGLGGNDTLSGGAGADTLAGGLGNDTYRDPAGDTIVENAGEGTDTVETSATFSIETLVNVERLFLTGSGAIDGTGNSLANQFIGNDAANVLTGRDGNDTINAGGGSDTLNGGSGLDRLIGGLQRDKIIPGADNVTDTIVYTMIGESTGQTRDILSVMDFNNEDKIDLPTVPTAFARAIGTGVLNLATFNQNLASVFTAAALPVGQAALFNPSSGDLDQPGMVYLIVDANGIAGYQANQDWVFQLENHTGGLDVSDFI